MDRKILFILGAASLICACSNDSSSSSSPTCTDDQKLYEGECYDKNECLPSCDDSTQKCYQGECRDKNECLPACDDSTQKCVEGTCIGIDECSPKCNDDEICQSGTCEPVDPTLCTGVMCKNKTTYCDDTGHWKDCPTGTGCHLGYCLKGLGSECEDDTCSDDNTEKCDGGTWVSCGSIETCENGKCVVSPDITCETGTCSDDGNYRCTDKSTYEACPIGTYCDEGQCVGQPTGEDNPLLWQLCTSNSDCARGICVFELSTSRTMSVPELGLIDVDVIPMSVIDNRIPEGTGVCAQDCTRDETICDEISNDIQKFTCQLMVIGSSPYPPKDEDGLEMSLPFHKALKVEYMETAPFASLCRPNDIEKINYSQTFCTTCTESSECGENESCIYGQCLPQCSDISTCPIGFTCSSRQDMDTSFCIPNAETCGSCLDKDGDGQGFGACPLSGFDCDDIRNDIYYNKPLDPSACSDVPMDDNCNGKIDYLELIGTADNCENCGSPCKADSDAERLERQCMINNGDHELDDSSPTAIAETYQFACTDYCETGYADCDGDVSNGCEIKLFEIVDGVIQPENIYIIHSLDEDNDGHGVMSESAQFFCCGKNSDVHQDVCYALPNTDTNTHNYWDKAVLNPEASYSTQIDDCDDKNDVRFAGNPEICDGQDNDCNEDTPDGYDALVKLDNYEYVSTDAADENKMGLGAKCTVYENSNHTKCTEDGVIACQGFAQGDGTAYRMICKADIDTTVKDDNCDEFDDNCNGLLNEDYVFDTCTITTNAGICRMGVQVCADGKVVCQQLYQPRDYDFYGDNVDSNCDGVDWDNAHAVFVERYQNAESSGLDTHSGRSNNPVATLSKAFERAQTKIGDQVLYHDIIVSKDVANLNNSAAKWGKEPIAIPTLPLNKRFTFNLKSAIEVSDTLNESSSDTEIHEAHVMAYQKKLNNDPNYQGYSPNDYLAPGEVYPGKEVIRVFGGFLHTETGGTNTWSPSSSSTYDYQLTTSNTSHTKVSETGGIVVYSLNDNQYTMIYPSSSDGPMSVQFSDFRFNFNVFSSLYAKLTGTTLIGLTCGKMGCDRLVLRDSPITVVAPEGVTQNGAHASNENFAGARNGVDGHVWETQDEDHSDSDYLGQGGGTTYGQKNYNNSNCMYSYFSSNQWFSYELYTSTYNYTCPDGVNSPRGGCGGTCYCKNNGDGNGNNYICSSNGQTGWGNSGGAGGNNSLNKSDKCPDATVDENKSRGSVGSNGDGGSGGKNTWLSVVPRINSNADLYMSTTYPIPIFDTIIYDIISPANGSVGSTGGGGGGGSVYHCYDMNGSWDRWVNAGTGGAAGCGGAGGKAGGTGGSAIGLVLIPPKDTKGYFDVNSSINVTGAIGGMGTSGQDGQDGGQGGKSVGYRQNTHCIKGTAGAAGGAGGGGGSGAGGLAGHAYGYFFVCNRNVNFSSVDHLDGCGFERTEAFKSAMNSKVTATAEKDRAEGNDGTAGSWNEAANNSKTGADKYAEWTSMHGTGGTASTGMATTGEHADSFYLFQTSEF